ncbi:MAG: proline--tRNA ligase [Spirochaetaceae bacterium]|jgi:prolyl-tRNA synthetase|nr:proline--tRNA ligase [Spirochaetaceae bacterium]
MKWSQFFIPTLREVPGDAAIASHRLMFRAGLIRKLSNGLFAYLPLGLRSFRKVESIVREEMDATGSLEIKPTVVIPGELWKESGRWFSMGDELLRIRNRLDADFVLSPTAEEAFTALVRDELNSYRQLPLSLYQINTKYRDEVRPRYGVMRGREFVMKDAYSYHTDDASLDETYQAMGRAYRQIFKRCGLSVIPVRADSGAMGGSGSEEFMVESEVGDNTLILCKECDYAANVEKATCKEVGRRKEEGGSVLDTMPSLEKIATPGIHSIADICEFLKCDVKSSIKTLIYRTNNKDIPFVAVCMRGDIEVNEVKLANLVDASEIGMASDEDAKRLCNASFGSLGPVGLKSMPIVADLSAAAVPVSVVGALEDGYHYKNAVYGRDWEAWKVADVRTVKAGDLCPHCGGELYQKQGNELGHIFKLGYKYTKSMQVSYLDEEGKSQIPTMGCYGIGIDRTLASIIEEHHDDKGIVWPMSVAPFQVLIVPIKYEGAAKEAADTLAAKLEALGAEVLLDDRNERPGVKFNDADLIGIPLRVVIGDKGLANNPPQIELKKRSEEKNQLISLENSAEMIYNEVRAGLACPL